MSENKKTLVTILKHFLFDPIKTPKEAKARIKELLPFLLVSVGAVLLFLILGIAIEPVKILFNILGYICAVIMLLFGWFMFRAFQMKKKLSDLECPNCKTIITYGPNVTYEVSNPGLEIMKFKTENSKGGVDIHLSAFELMHFDFTCKCQECGTVKKFKHTFKTVNLETAKEFGVSAITADALLMDMEKKMKEDYLTRFEQKSLRYNIKKNMTTEEAVKSYFCDDGTANKIGNVATVSEMPKK